MLAILAETEKLYLPLRISPDHDFSHVRAVYEHAQKACLSDPTITKEQEFIVLSAALLHDADDDKIFSTLDNSNARRILSACNVSPQLATRIIEVINLVSTRTNKNTQALASESWKLIPRHCDRLEAIGIIGIVRCYQYTLKLGNPLFTETTPRATTIERVMQIATPQRFAAYNGNSASMIDHFYDKLLHISDLDTQNKYLLSTAQTRKQVMIDFVLQFGRSGTVNMSRYQS